MVEKWSLVFESNFLQLRVKVQCKNFKSFLLCSVYRLPDAPINFLENLSGTLVDSFLQGLNVIILRDLNCNVLGNCPDDRAPIDFCSKFKQV